jgi:Domain of unknown function (DUF4249)
MKIILGLCILAALSGCEKNIDFALTEAPNVVAVDARIENGLPPVVVLTKSFSFFSSISPEVLVNSFVRNAVVTISNGTLMHQLKEYATLIAPGVNIYAYSIDSSSLGTAFIGELNKGYTLTIVSEGKEYTASTTIPPLSKKIDSLWWKQAPFQDDTTKIVLMAKATDPPGLGNYGRYFTKKNSGPFLPGENSVFNDEVIDGTTYNVQIEQGVDLNNRPKPDSNYFKRGDTITMKLCNIDKATYSFWSTWEFAAQSIGNPFSQPGKILGNISNGALGAFYGYASFYKTLVVPK